MPINCTVLVLYIDMAMLQDFAVRCYMSLYAPVTLFYVSPSVLHARQYRGPQNGVQEDTRSYKSVRICRSKAFYFRLSIIH